MLIDRDSIIYCDANFLIALAAKETRQPEIQRSAKQLFARLLIAKSKIVASPLTFDETWAGARRELGPKKVTHSFWLYLNPLLGKIGLKFVNYGSAEYYSYSEIKESLKEFTERLFQYQNFSIVQLTDPQNNILAALDELESLKPRDAFHLVIALNNGVTHFISNDNDFVKRLTGSKIQLVNF